MQFKCIFAAVILTFNSFDLRKKMATLELKLS